MASKDLDKERRDLYAVSLLISVYCLAGAELGKSASSPLSMTVQFPAVVMAAFLVAWLYFVWRYKLAMGKWNYDFGVDICNYHEANPTFQLATAKVLKHRLALMSDSDNDAWSPVWNELSERSREKVVKECTRRPGAKPFTANWKLSWIDLKSLGWPDAISPEREPPLELATKRLGMSAAGWWPWKRARIVATGVWRAIWKNRAFSDLWLPYIVGVGLPPIAILLRVTLPIYR